MSRKLKLCVHRKAGAPGYGSDGVGMELELELADDATAAQIRDQAIGWYATLESSVTAELARLQAQHPQPAASATQHSALSTQHSRDDRFPVGPPQPRRPQPEPGWDADDEPEQQYQPPRRQSAPPPAANGQGRSYGPPTNGRQLMAAVGKLGLIDQLKRLAKDADRGMIQDWDEGMVAWAYQELTRKQQQPAGQWGRN